MNEGTRCPGCGENMDPGSLGVLSHVAGALWYKRRTLLATGGQTVVSAPLGGMIYLDGARCERCRLMLLRY